jgi:hypothetical protein
MDERCWYETLRAEYQPVCLRVLLVAESPPNPTAGTRRFFYSETLTSHDNLFRSVALAAYGMTAADLATVTKPSVLRRLQADGYFLIDAVETPINHMTSTDKRRAIRTGIPRLVRRCIELEPTVGVFVISTPVHQAVAGAMTGAGITVLNPIPAPFPLGNTRAQFVKVWQQFVPNPSTSI